MQPQEATDAQSADICATVVMQMRRLGIPGFPRNYELFYEAATGRRGELAQALAALGPRPRQHQLDELSRIHLGGDRMSVMDDAQDRITTKLDEILAILKKERGSMATYGEILDQTASGLGDRAAMSKEFLERIVGVMSTATRTSIDNRDQLVGSITTKTSELQEVRSELEEYKKLADTDPLTQLYNRRAFDRAIAAVYDSNRGIAFGSLLLADIDRFKQVNDRFGHPIGDRIIQIVAGVLKSNVRDGFVARTGGEEFAVILEGMGEESTAALAERMRVAVMETPFVNVATGVNYGPITLSFGTCMATHAPGPDELYMKADRALYASKSAGRNRVTRASALSEGGFTKNWLIYRRD